MNIFVSALTVYRYDNDVRAMLNNEEASKFSYGLSLAKDPKRVYIFTDSKEVLENIDSYNLTAEEIHNFKTMVIGPLEVLANRSDVKVSIIPVDLTNYERVINTAEEVLRNPLESGKYSNVYLNLSCGHKVGSLALYVKLLNLVHSTKKVVLHPYHAENNKVEGFPVVNLTSTMVDVAKERYLEVFDVPKTYNMAKAEIKQKVHSDKDAEDIIINLISRGLIQKERDDEYTLTVRGRTLLALNRYISE